MLSQKIDIIARELLRHKAVPGCKVAVFQQPSVDWVASVVAILKIGAVYVPLDAATPVARLALIVDDSRPVAILTHSHTRGMTAGIHSSPEDFIDVTELSGSPPEPIPTTASPDAPAIILYTSGSTGTPKGVILKHSSIKHEFDHCAAIYKVGENDVVLQQSAWSFDLSITQLFLAISVGAKLAMVSHHVRPDASAIAHTIKDKGVTVTYATPTEYRSWLQPMHRDTLRTSTWGLALVAGEPVTEPLLQAFRDLSQPSLRLFNVYGPTETTCGSTKTELDYVTPFHYATIPVGRASANECFYIMDDKQNIQPVGQIGEVVIGGVGVGIGYLNNDKQTRASFLPDPFATPEYITSGWTTMYRTGDRGYLLADGTLILLGRIENDTEVKLNGVRTDLRDIEQTVIRTAPPGSIIDAAASQRSMPESSVSFMVVHVVLENNDEKENEKFLKELLKDLPLPRQMLPSALIPIQTLPRTIAGKLDRRALSRIPIESKVFKTSEPSLSLSQAEAQLLRLWEMVIPSDLIGLHRIEADSDFFQVGGSSMLLIQLQREIREHLQTSVQLLQLFQASTLRGMAGLLGLNGVATTEAFSWEDETALLPELEDISAMASAAHPLSPPRVVVLTGATGFLGQHLLQALNKSASVDKVICIANRNLTEERRALLFSGGQKVECYEGDLRAPLLGLTPEEASRIFETADAVIHNGSDVSHLKTYQSLRLANVGSTKELVKLCLPRRIPLHYVSTTGVTMYTTSETYAEASVRDAPPPVNGLYGYVATKWVNEVYLEAVNERYGLPVSIHRPSSIIRPEQDMTGDSPTADVLQNMLLYSRRIKAAPISPNWRGTVDLVSPETVTRKVVSAVMGSIPEFGKENKIVYIHESGDVEIELSGLQGYLSNETGTAIQELSLQDWTDLAEKNGLSSAMGAVIGGMGNFKQINFPRLFKEEAEI
jgi:hybrid polyketide synthase/nonribosomal peptide synthetase ACE1